MLMNRIPVSKKRLAAALAAAALIALVAMPVTEAQTAAKGQNRKENKGNGSGDEQVRPHLERRTSSGQQAFVDPLTGQLRAPTAVEFMLLSDGIEEMLSQSSEGLEVVELGDGTMMVDLQDRFQEIAVAAIVDGQVRMTCVNERSALEAFLKGLHAPAIVPPAPQPLEVK